MIIELPCGMHKCKRCDDYKEVGAFVRGNICIDCNKEIKFKEKISINLYECASVFCTNDRIIGERYCSSCVNNRYCFNCYSKKQKEKVMKFVIDEKQDKEDAPVKVSLGYKDNDVTIFLDGIQVAYFSHRGMLVTPALYEEEQKQLIKRGVELNGDELKVE